MAAGDARMNRMLVNTRIDKLRRHIEHLEWELPTIEEESLRHQALREISFYRFELNQIRKNIKQLPKAS